MLPFHSRHAPGKGTFFWGWPPRSARPVTQITLFSLQKIPTGKKERLKEKKYTMTRLFVVPCLLLLVLAFLLSNGAAVDDAPINNNVNPQQGRHLFWGWLFLSDLHCIGPKHCNESGGGGGGGGSSGGGGGGGSSSGGGGGGGGGSYSSHANSGSDSSKNGFLDSPLGMEPLAFWMMVAAAAAAAMALFALALGNRNVSRNKHDLTGSVSRRMVLFKALSNPDTLMCDRPCRTVETTLSCGDYNQAAPPNTSNNGSAVV